MTNTMFFLNLPQYLTFKKKQTKDKRSNQLKLYSYAQLHYPAQSKFYKEKTNTVKAVCFP